MKHVIAIALVLLAACGKSGEDAGREELARTAAAQAATNPQPAAPTPAATQAAPTAPPPAATPAAAPEPEPTTPAELDHALKQAMIDGRDKDVLKYCDMSKLDAKSNPQTLLGCTLSACRTKDVDTARRYSKSLARAYLDEAKKVCAADQVAL